MATVQGYGVTLRVEKDGSKWATRPAYRIVNMVTGRTIATFATRKECMDYMRALIA